MTTTLVGWASSLILLLTLAQQVHQQWKSKATGGVSPWLFIGQITASAGFAVYALLLGNWVFLSTNLMLICAAVLGEWLYLRNRKRARH